MKGINAQDMNVWLVFIFGTVHWRVMDFKDTVGKDANQVFDNGAQELRAFSPFKLCLLIDEKVIACVNFDRCHLARNDRRGG